MASSSPAAEDATSVRDPLIGARLGDYQVVGALGEGGMGVVYEGLHTVINKRVAIKVIKPEFAADQVLARRVLAEAQAVNAVRHRGIVDIHAHGMTPDGRPYLVMEKLHGETLADLLDRQGRLSLAEAVQLVFDATGPLFAAHKAGIVHRDLKPSNLFLCVDDDGERFLKLLDFGLAKRSAPGVTSSTMTSASLIVGTPDYMAPEQARAQPTDNRTDIYSLGVLAFELVAGRLPYTAGTSVDLVMQHLSAPVPRLVDLDPSVPGPLSQLVEQMMSKEPAKRPQTLEPVRAALKDLLATGLQSTPQVPLGTPALATPAFLTPISAPEAATSDTADSLPEISKADRTVITEVPAAPDDGTADTAMSLSKVGEKARQVTRRKLHEREEPGRSTDVNTALAPAEDSSPDARVAIEDSARPPRAGSRAPLAIGAALVVVILVAVAVVFASGQDKPVDVVPVDPQPPAPLEALPTVDVKPADAKPADAKPADAKPADAKPADAKPADVKPADAKPADAKPLDSPKRPDVKKPVEPKPKPAKKAPTREDLARRIDELEAATKKSDARQHVLQLISRYRDRLKKATSDADLVGLANDIDEFKRTQLK
jgi:serine/threonine-protein kinase